MSKIVNEIVDKYLNEKLDLSQYEDVRPDVVAVAKEVASTLNTKISDAIHSDFIEGVTFHIEAKMKWVDVIKKLKWKVRKGWSKDTPIFGNKSKLTKPSRGASFGHVKLDGCDILIFDTSYETGRPTVYILVFDDAYDESGWQYDFGVEFAKY